MNARPLVTSAIASALALALAEPAAAQPKPKEKCYGVAKAGQNDCGNLAGSHTCAGQSKTDYSVEDWKYVPKGTCKQLKGKTEEEVQAEKKERSKS